MAQIISACEERLIKDKVITAPFTATEIQGGVLKQYLIDDDYTAPLKVWFVFNMYHIICVINTTVDLKSLKGLHFNIGQFYFILAITTSGRKVNCSPGGYY